MVPKRSAGLRKSRDVFGCVGMCREVSGGVGTSRDVPLGADTVAQKKRALLPKAVQTHYRGAHRRVELQVTRGPRFRRSTRGRTPAVFARSGPGGRQRLAMLRALRRASSPQDRDWHGPCFVVST